MEEKGNVYELEEQLLNALLDVSEKRKEMPSKCAELVAENLRLKQSLDENSILLPRTDVKKLACKYPLDKPLNTTFNLPKVQASVQEISLMISQVREERKDLAKIVKMCNEQSNQ